MKEEEILKKTKIFGRLKQVLHKIKSEQKKIYLKKFEEIAGFSVWIVNGKFIRKNICEDFVNFGQHYHFKFIPKNEFWIDKEARHHEMYFYVEHLLIENRLMAQGTNYSRAYFKEISAEKKERARSSVFKKLKNFFKKKKPLNKIHKKLWINNKDKLSVWIVNGEVVRDFLDVAFTEGSHGYIDSFIPKDEIWIDDDIFVSERKIILIHELHERRMMKNKKMKYLQAHKLATIIEDYCRKHPKKVNKILEKEFCLV